MREKRGEVMTVKKKLKKTAKQKLTEAEKKRIKAAIKIAEDKAIANYRKAARMSGANWKKIENNVKAKVRKDMAKAETRIETQVGKHPAAAMVVAAAIGAIVEVLAAYIADPEIRRK
jgi:hypothetical protein